MHLSRATLALVGPAAIALSLAPMATGSAAGSAGRPAAGSSHTKVVANCLKPKFEPKRVILTCADANSDLSHIHYTSWTKRRATGRAHFDFNDCTPNCAAGTWKHQHVRFVMKRVRREHGSKVFTDIVVNDHGQKTSYSPGI